MSERLFLCRVRALYPYTSKDPSALCFAMDDYIDVLQKLDSGWWEGWCNGSRGWFPSNFVHVVENYSSTQQGSTKDGRAFSYSADTPATPKTPNGVLLRKNNEYRLSLPVSDASVLVDSAQGSDHDTEMTPAELPFNWTTQMTEDGSSCYYYNTVTGEMRTTHPGLSVDDESDYGDDIYTPKMGTSFDSEPDEEEDADEADYVSNGEDDDRTYDFKSVDSRPWEERVLSDVEFPEKIAPITSPWIKRQTRNGKAYYHNPTTKETTWDEPGVGYQAPTTRTEKPFIASWKRSASFPSCQLDIREDLTWNKLAANITAMINALDLAATTKQSPVCFDHAAAVVNAIRTMLVTSGTIDKDSTFIQSHTLLRSHHRTMMAAMSKLALSSQLCHTSSEHVKQLLTEAKELHATARNFVGVCQEIPVPVEHVNPRMLPENEAIKKQETAYITESQRYKYTLQNDLIDNLDTCGTSLKESMTHLLQLIPELPLTQSRMSLAGTLFTQFRDLGNQNGQFQGIVDDTEFGLVKESSLLVQTYACKCDLSAALGRIFYQLQLLTDSHEEVEAIITSLRDVAKEIDEYVDRICGWMRELVAEEETRQAEALAKGAEEEDVDEKSSFAGTGFSMDGDNTPSNITEYTDLSVDRKYLFGRRGSAVVSSDISVAAAAAVSSTSSASVPTTPLATTSEAAEKATPSKSAVPERQWFLEYDYKAEEIVFTQESQVKGGTLRALVERLTLHDFLDMNFINTFLLTYRSFCTSMELLTMLEGRFNLTPPAAMDGEEREVWEQKKLKLVRLRVCNVLKNWLEVYYNEDDYGMLDRLLRFTQTSIRQSLSSPSEQLQRLIRQRIEAEPNNLKKMILMLPDPPEPILPRNRKKFRLLDIDALEMARQMTIMDFKLYSSIRPIECLDKAWSRDTGDDGNCIAINIRASIEYCNQVTAWVSDAILSQVETKKRSVLIKYWVLVAEKCRLLNNFNTCMAILSAFDNSSVGRLKRTWETVGTRTTQTLAHIRKLMGANRNFTEYRAIIHSVNPPCIPFLGIYLQDLTFIEDGNANHLKQAKELINFAKRAKTAEVIREIQQYQSSLYQLKPVDELQAFIQANLQSSRDEEQLYHESLKLEPKEREDEKITRLLQESGFL